MRNSLSGPRIICDDVNDMSTYELVHNQFFVKDKAAWHRDFERELSCMDLVREIAINQGIWHRDYDQEIEDDELFEETMHDSLSIGTDQPIGVLAMYYTAMYGLANMRHHCIELQKKLDAGSRVKKETNAEMICKDIDKLAEALFIADVQWNGACSAEIDESTGSFANCKYESERNGDGCVKCIKEWLQKEVCEHMEEDNEE